MPHGVGLNVQRDEQRGEELCEDRLADPPESEARHGDAELRRAEERVEMGNDVPRDFRPPMAFNRQRIELRLPDSHESKLRRDEKAVQEHQPEHEQDLQNQISCTGGVAHSESWLFYTATVRLS